MAWNYFSALRSGNTVTVRFREAALNDTHEITITKYGQETEPQFVTRGRTEIAGWEAGLNAQLNSQTDVTNTFRPAAG